MLEEKRKISSAIEVLEHSIVQMNDHVPPDLDKPKKAKKVDGRTKSSRDRLLKVWELSRRLGPPLIEAPVPVAE